MSISAREFPCLCRYTAYVVYMHTVYCSVLVHTQMYWVWWRDCLCELKQWLWLVKIIATGRNIWITSLVPREEEEEEKGPGTHWMCVRYFPSKSWEFVFLSAYLSVNVNLDLRYMPKNHFCRQHFGRKTPAVTNLAITSEQYQQKNKKEAMRRTSTHV